MQILTFPSLSPQSARSPRRIGPRLAEPPSARQLYFSSVRRGVRARKRRLNNSGANNEREGHREREVLCIKEKLFMHSAPFDVMMPRMCTPLGELILSPPGAWTDPKSCSNQKLECGHSVCVWLDARKKTESGNVRTYLQDSFYFHEVCAESLSCFLPNLRAVLVLPTMGRRQTLYWNPPSIWWLVCLQRFVAV